jgi:hypothetical protein
MSFLRKALPLVLLSSTSLMFSQFTDVINSNRPGESMGAFAVGKTIIQPEAGISYITENHNLLDYDVSGLFMDFDLRYGFLLEELEFIAELQYRDDTYETPFSSEARSALKHSIVGFKYLIYDPYKHYRETVNVYSWKANQRFKWRDLIPAFSVYAGVNLNLFDTPYTFYGDPKVSPKLMFIFQNQFMGGWVIVTNIFTDRFTTDYPTLGGILTVTKSFNHRWSGFLEGQAFQSDFYADIVLRGGAAFLVNEDLQLDISVGKNFKDTPDIFYGGIGVSWRFTLNYEDVVIFDTIENESQGKDKKSKKEKTTEEAPQE